MAVTQNQSDKTSSFAKISNFLKNLKLICHYLFSPWNLFWRLKQDDKRLKKYNDKNIPATQVQSADPQRKKIILAMAALFLIQGLCLFAVTKGYGTSGFGNPARALSKLFTQFRIPARKELFDLRIIALFFFCSAAGSLAEFMMFKRKKGLYRKMLDALKPDEYKGEPWFYTGKVLYLSLNNVTGEDFLRRTPMWNNAGFEPTIDICRIPGENTFLFTAAPKKPSNSTYIYDRYEEWTALMNDKLMLYHWFLGEYVKRMGVKWTDAYKGFTIAFIGQSGSGKTEAMKMWITAFFAKHPNTRLVIDDLKKTGDWDVLGPLTECGYIVKTEEETLLTITYFMDVMMDRTKHMAEKSYKNIKAWSDAEGIDVPPMLLVIDEFPQLATVLKYDIQSKKDGTAANALFQLMTKGRSFGLWVIVGSQFSGSDAIPTEMNKNVKVHVTLRTGSPGESIQWINSEAAFRLGKGVRKPDGSEDGQEGYAYVDAEEEFVRFWYLDDWYIVHEFLKYGVPTMEGFEHIEARKPSKVPHDLKNKIQGLEEQGKGINHLSREEREYLKRHQTAIETFSKTYDEMKKLPHPNLAEKKKPLGLLWRADETVEEFVARFRTAKGVALPASPAARMGGMGSPMMPRRENSEGMLSSPRPPVMPKLETQIPNQEPMNASEASKAAQNNSQVKKSVTEDDSDEEFNKLLDERRKRRKEELELNRQTQQADNEKKAKAQTKAKEEVKDA